jgi:hypothetical protein
MVYDLDLLQFCFFGRNQYIEGANYKVAKNKIQEKKIEKKTE